MIRLETAGAMALLAALRRVAAGRPVSEDELGAVLDANGYMIGFYASWPDSDRASIEGAFRHVLCGTAEPSGNTARRLAAGLSLALDQLDLLESRLDAVETIDMDDACRRVLDLLPGDTPLDSVIHMTVDHVNGAFAYQGQMGVSLLTGVSSEDAFLGLVSHELHHVGFRVWAKRDELRQRILAEGSARSVAVEHVQNLLMEGLANYYLTPLYVFRAAGADGQKNPLQTRLARLEREEEAFLAQADNILAMSLADDADPDTCAMAYRSVAMDFEDYQLPAAHYLGARMVQTIDQAYGREGVVACVRRLDGFLPLYNETARTTGRYMFDPDVVARFDALLCE